MLVLLGTIGFSAYAYTVYLPSLATASPGSGTLNIYLADPPPSNNTLKYLLVNVTSVTLQYSSNATVTTATSTANSASSITTSTSASAGSATSTTETAAESSFVNRFIYNVSSSVGTNVNLTEYQGSPLLLGSPKVPTGNVTGVILDITGARAFWADGTSTQLKVVANGKLMVHVQFAISTGDNANMNIGISPASVHVSQGDVLRPVLMVSVTSSDTSTTETSTSGASSTTSSTSSASSS